MYNLMSRFQMGERYGKCFMSDMKLTIKAAICVVIIDACAGTVCIDSELEPPVHDVGAALYESASEVVVGAGNLYRGEKISKGISTKDLYRDETMLDLVQVTLP